ncbi:GntR family transcriptional regulator, histidine utilization repressor [Pseudidiomarina maritima]|uniref:Histidine utilization repressor n=1 Tax=Pseudidiomarina maritima TaxID=519453 RepID=A0A1I6H9H0_9GAMM|nr:MULTISPECIES: histidine utilization repressor [Pseudidiomarina]SFR50964.1 GntR family transcriptional regulator, histidine utilization repressor [Pseudidiomarina maritima]
MKFSKIKQHIYSKIASGEWPENHPVSSENALAIQFKVSRMTARRALQELADEGLVIRSKGSGTYVAPLKSQTSFMAIRNIADEIRARQHDYEAHVHVLRQVPASLQVAEQLQVEPETPVFYSVITHLENGLPVQVEERYVNPAVATDYLKQDFRQITPHEYLSAVAPLTEASHQIEAVTPSTHVCEWLELAKPEPCLRIVRRTWSDAGVVTYAVLTHPGSRFVLGGHLTFKA